MDKVQFCPVCKQKGMPPKCPGYWILSEDEPLDSCYYDGCKETKVYNISSDDFHMIFKISDDINFLETMIKLKESDIIEYNLKMSQFRNQIEEQEKAKQIVEESDKPKCPICNSTNLSKISITKKTVKIATFGIFGMGDNGKTWKCNNCGSKF